jgi:hypothetical protein
VSIQIRGIIVAALCFDAVDSSLCGCLMGPHIAHHIIDCLKYIASRSGTTVTVATITTSTKDAIKVRSMYRHCAICATRRQRADCEEHRPANSTGNAILRRLRPFPMRHRLKHYDCRDVDPLESVKTADTVIIESPEILLNSTCHETNRIRIRPALRSHEEKRRSSLVTVWDAMAYQHYLQCAITANDHSCF